MTTDTSTPTPQQELATIESNLAQARAALEDAQRAFLELASGAHKDKSADEQLAIASAFMDAQSAVEKLTESHAKTAKRVRTAVLDEPLKSIREALRRQLQTLKLETMLHDADAGNSVSLTAVYKANEDGSGAWEVSGRFPGAISTGATRSTASDGTGGGGRLTFKTPDGEFGSKDYVFKYFDAAKTAGYKSSRASAELIPANEYAKIGPVIAEKLGHEVVRVQAAAN